MMLLVFALAASLAPSSVIADGNSTKITQGGELAHGLLRGYKASAKNEPVPFEPKPFWWHDGAWPMRTLSPTCSGFDYDKLIAAVEKVSRQGVRVIAINSMYDPGEGYDRSSLWCGLAGNDYMMPLRSVFPDGLDNGSPDGRTVKNFVDHVHQLGMAVVSWMNPSYIWTGSAYFTKPIPGGPQKQAGDGKCSKLPDGQAGAGKCRWFKWAYTQDKDIRMQRPPKDSVPDVPACPACPNGGKQCKLDDWVDDDGTNAYFSYWAGYPTINWEDPEWQAEYEKIVEYWLSPDKGNLDGFVFDYPNGYIPGGDDQHSGSMNSGLNRKATSPVKDFEIHPGIKNSKAVFAELYDSSGPVMAQKYNIDSFINDDTNGTFGLGSRALYIEESFRCAVKGFCTQKGGSRMPFQSFNTFDDAFSGFGGVDAATLHCAKTGYCATTWNRLVTTSNQFQYSDEIGSLQAVAWVTAGAIPDVVADVDGKAWWTDFDWQGEDMLEEIYLKAQSPALRPLSLRIPACFANADATGLCTGSSADGKMYSMVRYDGLSFGTGRYAVVTLCLSSEGCSDELDLERTFKFWGTDRFAGMSKLSKIVELPRFGHLIEADAAFAGPVWSEAQAKNCWGGQGSSYNPDDGAPPQTMNIGSCFLYCASDSGCNAVTVKWTADGKVECHRKKVSATKPLSGCADSDKDEWATFYFLN